MSGLTMTDAAKTILYDSLDSVGYDSTTAGTSLVLKQKDEGSGTYSLGLSDQETSEEENKAVRQAVLDSLIGPGSADGSIAHLRDVAMKESNAKIVKDFLLGNPEAPLTGEDVRFLMTCLKALSAQATGEKSFGANATNRSSGSAKSAPKPVKQAVKQARVGTKIVLPNGKTTVQPPRKPAPPRGPVWEAKHQVTLALEKKKMMKKSGQDRKVTGSAANVGSKKEMKRGIQKTVDVVVRRRGDPNTIIRNGKVYGVREDGTEERIIPHKEQQSPLT